MLPVILGTQHSAVVLMSEPEVSGRAVPFNVGKWVLLSTNLGRFVLDL